MENSTKKDMTYKLENPVDEVSLTSPGDSPSNQAPEKLFPLNAEPASSKEAIHDAPEVVQTWLSNTNRPSSPFSIGETVTSGFQPLEVNEKGEPLALQRESENPLEKKSKVCGFPQRYFVGGIILIWVVLFAIGLGVGLGVGLKKKKNTAAPPASIDPSCVEHPEHCIGGALGSNYYTTNGTFNGSGIALATEFWNHQERKIMTVYFQHWTGDIRWIQLTPRGDWLGGSKSETIVIDAKNATPISVVSYAINGTAQWHLFYLDETNMVRQRQNTNATNIWQEGPLNELNLTAYDAPNVGLQACWYGNYYGDSDASKFPIYDGSNNTIPFDAGTPGMHLWYPTNESSFRQYGWFEGQKQWTEQHTWTDMNAHAGVGCFSWGPGSSTYAMMVNQANTAEIWWKDTNTNTSSTPSHPINIWQNMTNFAINDVYPSTSLGYTEYLYAQMADGAIKGHRLDWKSENTTAVEEDTFSVGGPRGIVAGIKGTHMSVTQVDDQSGGKSLYVFYQTRGDDLSVFTRDMRGGQWTQGELPIPDD